MIADLDDGLVSLGVDQIIEFGNHPLVAGMGVFELGRQTSRGELGQMFHLARHAAFHGGAVQFVFHFEERTGGDGAVGPAIKTAPHASAVGHAKLLLPVSDSIKGIEIFGKNGITVMRVVIGAQVLGNPRAKDFNESRFQDELEFTAVLAGVHLRNTG